MTRSHAACLQRQFGSQKVSECELTQIACALDPKPIPQTDGYLVRCPCHDDKTASLSLRWGTHGILLHCFAGCAREQVIAELRRLGLWPLRRHVNVCPSPSSKPPSRQGEQSSATVVPVIDAILRGLRPAPGTPAETYFRFRAITDELPSGIGFHPRTKHGPTNTWHPAVVARVLTLSGDCIALHRIFISSDGRGKAEIDPPKLDLGPKLGCAIHLDKYQHDKLLVLTEGVETGLSVRQQMRKNGRECAVWSTLGTEGLRSLILPREAADILIAADNDAPGEAAAQDAARRWMAEGRRVSIARPPVEFNDFNDVLQARRAGEIAHA
jgi:putative DNA primase/helicase